MHHAQCQIQLFPNRQLWKVDMRCSYYVCRAIVLNQDVMPHPQVIVRHFRGYAADVHVCVQRIRLQAQAQVVNGSAESKYK